MLVILGFLVTFSSAFGFLEKYFYPNYVYSHIGINPEYVYLATAFLLVIYYIRYTKSALLLLSLFIIGFSTPGIFSSSLSFLVKTTVSRETSTDQVVKVYGEKFRFIEFVKSITAPNAIILIPPNTLPFRHTGDVYLMQSWLYPRKIYTASYSWVLEPEIFKIFDYVLISSESEGKQNLTWPNFSIPAEKIVIYNWEYQSGLVTEGLDFIPNTWQNKQPWGLIVPKKI